MDLNHIENCVESHMSAGKAVYSTYARMHEWMNGAALVCVCAQRLEKKPSILVRWKNKQLNNIETTNKRIMQLLFLTVHTSEQGIIRLWYNSRFKGKSVHHTKVFEVAIQTTHISAVLLCVYIKHTNTTQNASVASVAFKLISNAMLWLYSVSCSLDNQQMLDAI